MANNLIQGRADPKGKVNKLTQTISFGTEAILTNVRLVKVRLTKPPRGRIRFVNCYLEECDVRELNWPDFDLCMFVRCLLPRDEEGLNRNGNHYRDA